MTPIPVLWCTYHPETIPRGYWDQAILEDLFAGQLYPHRLRFDHVAHTPDGAPGLAPFDAIATLEGQGAIVVIPARHHAGDVARIVADLARLPWAVVMLTGDEEGAFPQDAWDRPWPFDHGRCRVWIQSPRFDRVEHISRFPTCFGDGWRPGFSQAVTVAIGDVPADTPRRFRWGFAGQVTHDRRRAWIQHASYVAPHIFEGFDSFTGGLDLTDYLAVLTNAEVGLAPAGPVHAGTFRLWEALEAGCVPLVDMVAGNGVPMSRPMQHVLGAFTNIVPTAVHNPARVPDLLADVHDRWHVYAAQSITWWRRRKRDLVAALARDLDAVHVGDVDLPAPDPVTALITTSPIPSHPDTDMIVKVADSIRSWWPDAELIIAADGVRPEQEHLRDRYERYLHRLAWEVAQRRYGPATLHIAARHVHQAELTRQVLERYDVATPLLLFCEHDTPLVTDEMIDVAGCEALLLDNLGDVIRFHHEALVLPDHRHLMVDPEPIELPPGRFWRTQQWSQRPHLARTAYYRRILENHFTPQANTMIEDRMHSVLQSDDWGRHRVWVYAPDDRNIKRSYHLDGRADEPKFTETFTS